MDGSFGSRRDNFTNQGTEMRLNYPKKVIMPLAALFFGVNIVAAQQVGEQAPVFEGLNKFQGSSIQGTFSSSDFAGTIIVYNFFGST